MEFFGPGVANLSMDYRVGIDVMTTETTCLSSVWQTDQQTKTALTLLGRGNSYQSFLLEMAPTTTALVTVDLDQVEPMIALPFHPPMPIPSACFGRNMADLLHQVEERPGTAWG